MPRPINIVIAAQTEQLINGLGDAERAVRDSSADMARSTDKIDSAYSSVADSADQVASRGAQAAGALSGLGALASEAGGPFAALGGAMAGAGVAAQHLSEAGDLVNLVTDLGIGKNTLLRVQTIATTAAQKGAAAASKAWAVAQGGLNIVMSANPIGLVVLAVVALVAIFVVAYKKSDKFREIVNKAFSSIKDVASDVAGFFTTKIPSAFQKVQDAASTVKDWVKKNWPLLLAILTGPFGLAVLAIVKNYDKIRDGAQAAIKFVTDKFGNLVNFFTGLPGKIGGIFSGLWSGVADGLKGALNSVLHLPLTIPVIDTHIPGVGKVGGQTLIPALASGGIVNRPTLALIGEAGPEAVIPLNGRYGFGGTQTVEVVLTAEQLTDMEHGRRIRLKLDAYEGIGGRQRAR